MSKKAVIELSKEELELLDTLLWRGIDESSSDYWDDGAKLMANIEEQAKKNRSNIEWHPVAERIGKGYDILIRFDNGNVAPALSDDFDYAIERGAIEWAYLPE